MPRTEEYLLMNWTTKGVLKVILTSDELDGGPWRAAKETGDVRVRLGVTRLTGLGTTVVAELVWLCAEHKRPLMVRAWSNRGSLW